MTTIFVRQKVNDYDSWRQEYDRFDAQRQEMGVTGHSVYRDADDPNTVIVTHDFKDTATAKAFANAPELQAAMEQAGAAGPPEIWFGEES